MNAKAPAFRMTPVFDRLLRGSADIPVGLYHLHIATAEQLTRLHYSPASIKRVQARLKTLADNGYVQADTIPTRNYRSPLYYALGGKGARYLANLGLDVADRRRRSLPHQPPEQSTHFGHRQREELSSFVLLNLGPPVCPATLTTVKNARANIARVICRYQPCQ